MHRFGARLPELTFLVAALLSALWLAVCVTAVPATPGIPPPCVTETCKPITDYYMCGFTYAKFLYPDCRVCVMTDTRCQGAYPGACLYADDDQRVKIGGSGSRVCDCDTGINTVEAKDVPVGNFILTGEKRKGCFI
jgi:hypothetical protein